MAETTLTEEPAAAQSRAEDAPHFPRAAALLRLVIAAAGGLLISLAFPPVEAWPLAPVGAAVILLAVQGQTARRAAALGFVAGLGLFLPLLTWIRMDGFTIWMALTAWIGVSVIQAAYFAPLGAALAVVTRLPGWPVWSAALWIAEEAVRGRFPFGGLTWGRLAFSQGHSAYTPYAALAGAPFVSFLVALCGGLIAWAVLATAARRHTGTRSRPVAGAMAVIAALVIPAAGYAVPLPTDGRTVTVAAVQGNVPRAGLEAFGQRRAVLLNHVEATHKLADRVRAGKVPRPDFVVWPENASDIDPYASEFARGLIHEAVQDVGVPVLVGALVGGSDPQHVRNVGIVWNPRTGPGESYQKRHLVPFGEYVPFRDTISRVTDVYEQIRPRDIVAGTRPGTLTIAGVPIADTICFDVAYDATVRQAVTGGGQLLVVQTNNASFGHTAQPEQQLAIERLRAVEHGRAMVVAATSGISAIISPDGRVTAKSEPFTQEILVERVPLRDELTLADRVGAVPEWVLAGAGLAAVLIAAVGAGRARRRPH